MSSTDFLQLLTDGLVLGSMYGLIAVGYTMVYGILQIINFAHGEIFMLGGFGALFVYAWVPALHETSLWVALPVMLVVAVLVSTTAAVAAERFAYRPLRGASRLAPLITAIGLSLFLQQVVFNFFTLPGSSVGVTAPVPFPQLPGRPLHLGGVTVSYAAILTVVVAAAAMTGLAYFVGRTRTGRAMQATAQDPKTARLMGIDTDRIIVVAFAIGAVLAAFACVTQGLRLGTISYNMGFIAGLKGFTAAVLGGIGNIHGAMLGGVVLGVAESLASGLLPHIPSLDTFGGSVWKDVWAFVILIVVLLVRPQGLLGERIADRA
ncbi:branched-chain amino acid ABC transporter permease [Streptomyces justiciae]|uniref:Branched-chain amino acid ABC transporter permease n=1 Tax=Streptomyces justiciae TaxID=2780140 RepID=A0ABU3M4D6_9ACTN|nr:branched-chain amino acid ABC transporter permease [Streptomyces justiciae]MDT7845598.1 branched-chain amino acid ABC transporter permease [Streptomyces justiciae]